MSRAKLDLAFRALRDDLVHPDGPRISTMRRLYNYAIVQYEPELELALRAHVRELAEQLDRAGWMVHTISLYQLLLRRLEADGGAEADAVARFERRLAAHDRARAFQHVRDKLHPHLEGPRGLAADVGAEIDRFLAANPEHAERTVILIGRAGALYPFFRVGALLKLLDGRTRGVPVILLYPGTRGEGNALSFMGKLPAEGDYRPRIYP